MTQPAELPTNNELRADLTAIACDVFNIALRDDYLPPDFEGKPVECIELNITKVGMPAYLRFEKESLQIQTLRDGYFDYFPVGLSPSESAAEDQANAINSIASMIIRRSTDFQDTILPIAIAADYTATCKDTMEDGEPVTLVAGTLDESSTKIVLASAKGFAEEALEYVNSDRFPVPLLHGLESSEDGNGGRMNHQLSLQMRPDLPLSGDESREFLESYQAEMSACYRTSIAALKHFDVIGEDIVLDDLGKHYFEYVAKNNRDLARRFSAAASRASAILGKRT